MRGRSGRTPRLWWIGNLITSRKPDDLPASAVRLSGPWPRPPSPVRRPAPHPAAPGWGAHGLRVPRQDGQARELSQVFTAVPG